MAEKADRETTYDIITVDWKPKETRIWRHYVEKNCPTANIYTIKDTKPYPWNWASGKLNVFDYPLSHPDRFIYLDTDTIVTTDLEPIFDMMGDAQLSASGSITPDHLRLKEDTMMLEELGLAEVPVHYNSGFTVWKGIDPAEISIHWKALYEFEYMRPMRKARTFNEFCLSYMVAFLGLKVWDQPANVHANLCGRYTNYNRGDGAMVIHYHKPERLDLVRLGGLLNV